MSCRRRKKKAQWGLLDMKETKTEKTVLEFIQYFKKMNFVEVLGFGKLLNVEEKDDFEDYLTEICCAYLEKPRAERRKLKKLAKDVISGR